MNKYRVLRIIEYIYDTPEDMERDMARWSLHSPPRNKGVRFKSTSMPFETMEFSSAEDYYTYTEGAPPDEHHTS